MQALIEKIKELSSENAQEAIESITSWLEKTLHTKSTLLLAIIVL